MKLSLKWPFQSKNKYNDSLVTDNADAMVEIPDEKELLLRNLDEQQLESLFFRTNLSRDTISLEFVQKLHNSPTLLSYLINNIFDNEIIMKINNGSLKVSDVISYKKELFDYDIFIDEDKEILDVLRKNTQISDMGYVFFKWDDFEKSINSNNYIDSNISSFIEGESIVIDRTKAILLPQDSSYLFSDVSVACPLEQDGIRIKDIFDFYYTKELSINNEIILFISYDVFLEWLKDNNKREILKTVQVVINEDYNKSSGLRYGIRDYKAGYNLFTEDNVTNDKLIIQANHLLYLVENSELDKELIDYYKHFISKNFLAINNDNSYLYFGNYQFEHNLRELASEINRQLDNDKIKRITNEFNNLSIDDKKKDIVPTKFTAEIFLTQLGNIEEMSSFEVLKYVSYLNDDERSEVLSNDIIINKLRGLLKESARDEYPCYEEICRRLKSEEIFKVFDADFVIKFFKTNKTQTQYRFFFKILENDVNGAVRFFLNDDKYFKEFIKDMDKFSLSKLDYSLVVEMLKKIEKDNLAVKAGFLYGIDSIVEFKLLKEDFSNEFLVKIVENSSQKVQQFFYLEDERFSYLWDRFNILNLSCGKYKFSDDVISKNGFFDRFKSTSMVNFRSNVNQFLAHNPSIYFEEKIDKYEDELISNFDPKSGLFIQYQYLIDNISLLDDRKFITGGIDFFYDTNTNFELRQLRCIGYDENDKLFIRDKEKITNYLQWLSKRKLNEVIIDRLFKDNIYNVFLNIKEMLRYNGNLSVEEKILDSEQIEFYNTILNIDNLDSNVILELYNKFKDKNIALMFYEDMQKLKNKAYDKIKDDMFKPEDMTGLEDSELSKKYGVPVFDLRDKDYVMLVRCLSWEHVPLNHNRRDCYSIISNDNAKVFDKNSYIYGYSGFDNDCVLHMFEGDSFSGDVKNSELSVGSDRVNRIMTGREIASNSDWYSEVQIVNKRSTDNPSLFETLRPSFLIVYDEIDEKTLEEAKRKNIPICIICNSLNLDVVKEFSATGVSEELRYTPEWGLYNEGERRKNR